MGYAVTMKIVKSALGFYFSLSFWCAGTTLHPRSQQVNSCRQCFQAQHAAGVRVFLKLSCNCVWPGIYRFWRNPKTRDSTKAVNPGQKSFDRALP